MKINKGFLKQPSLAFPIHNNLLYEISLDCKLLVKYIQSNEGSGRQLQTVLALLVSGVIIVTIVIVFVILILALKGKDKNKKHNKTLRKSKRRHRERDDLIDSENNNIFAARGQADDPKKPPDGSGSFVFSGQTMDKPIPRVPEDSYGNTNPFITSLTFYF